MPRPTEVEKLATSDSSGGRARCRKKRRYHLPADLSPGRTRGQSKQLETASSALLQIGDLSSGNQPGADATTISAPTPALTYPNMGSQPPSDNKKFVDLPVEWTINEKTETETTIEGNRLVDVKQLQSIVSKNFCCRSCMPRAMKTYLDSFFDFCDMKMREIKIKANKVVDAGEKVRLYEREMSSIRHLYRQFTGYDAKTKKKKREEQLSVAIEMEIDTIGLASEIRFQCDCRRHFKNKDLRPHIGSVIPTRVSNGKRGSHATYLINNNAVSAFHHIGCGPYHMQQLAAWLDHPWQMIPKCFKKTEKHLGEIKQKVSKRSMEDAIMMEKELTINNCHKLTYDNKSRLGIVGSLDMHWPQRGSGRSYSSDSGASYLVGAQTMLILGSAILCKTCRVCNEFLKKKGQGTAINKVPNHRCYKNFAKTNSSKMMEPRAAVQIVTQLTQSPANVFLSHIVIDDDTTTIWPNCKINVMVVFWMTKSNHLRNGQT